MSRSYLVFLARWTGRGLKTDVVDVYSRSNGAVLGVIRWYSSWRQYVFEPSGNTVWSDGCLEEVRAKLAELNVEQRERRRSPAAVTAAAPGSARPGKA